MFGIGLEELILTLVIGLIVIGPKEIPIVAITVIKFIRKIKGLFSDINKSVEIFITETELNSVLDDNMLDNKSKEEVKENDRIL